MSRKYATEHGRCVYITGPIDASMEAVRRNLRELVLNDPHAPISLVINSPGGAVLGGFAILDELVALQREANVQIVGVVQGQAASMGLTILQGCDRRIAGPNSVLMAHGSHGVAAGDSRTQKAYARLIEIMHLRMATLYAGRTVPAGGKGEAEWLALFEHDTPVFLGAREALDWGLIDEIVGA